MKHAEVSGPSVFAGPWREWFLDALLGLPYVLGLLVACEHRADAYTDPGSGALIWQMACAGFVGLMFYVRRFTGWFKARKKDSQD
jgi:hypothetical protein